MTWQALPDAVIEVRNRWRNAPKVGPWSRHKRSIELLRHAQADIATLLDLVDTTRRDPVAELCHELASLGAERIEIHALSALAGERGRYSVSWSCCGESARWMSATGWSPCVALRKAIRTQRGQHTLDSDALTTSEGGRS